MTSFRLPPERGQGEVGCSRQARREFPLYFTVATIATHPHHVHLLRHRHTDVLGSPCPAAYPRGYQEHAALVAIADGAVLQGELLRFSDRTAGVYDFAPFVEATTEMTAPLADRAFFARYFIELGARACPQGFDLNAASLRRRLEQTGGLRRDAEAA